LIFQEANIIKIITKGKGFDLRTLELNKTIKRITCQKTTPQN